MSAKHKMHCGYCVKETLFDEQWVSTSDHKRHQAADNKFNDLPGIIVYVRCERCRNVWQYNNLLAVSTPITVKAG